MSIQTIRDTYPIVPARWVKPAMLQPLFGITIDAARKKREKGIWLEGKHFKKVIREGYLYNWKAIEEDYDRY
ncbi:excisionase family protein [Pleionea sediminis]|uniref:excisionase family protein n=1 Tax=Pleionea sediminis TaxID=2569479 RepID=UPI00197BED9C|nr:excisionase family protein [Pleionea sediminis]